LICSEIIRSSSRKHDGYRGVAQQFCVATISHRCSWMSVYVSCCNAQRKSHSDPLDICTLSLFYELPNCNLFSQHVLFYLMETPLVNCGPRSYFLYISITCLLYSHCVLSHILLLLSTRYAHTLCLQQTGEIDNLIVS
jgi:hypothetical protein